MPNFMILMNENDGAWEKLSEDEQRTLLARYSAWVKELMAKDIFQSGEAVGPGGRVIRNVEGEIVVRPFAQKKDVLTGYFVIEADDLDAATAIARGCPALSHGETVIVRPVGQTE